MSGFMDDPSSEADLMDYRNWFVGIARGSGRLEPHFATPEAAEDWRAEHRRWSEAYEERYGVSLDREAMELAGIGH